MEGKRFIKWLGLENFLSFGEYSVFELQPLNVLIGPNGSGKSNLIEAISILKATAGDLTEPIRKGGGIGEWIWKGERKNDFANISVSIDYPKGAKELKHSIALTMRGQRTFVYLEDVTAVEKLDEGSTQSFYYSYPQGKEGYAQIRILRDKAKKGEVIELEALKHDQSILAQLKDPERYPGFSYLGEHYSNIAIYRVSEWAQSAAARKPQATDLPVEFLLPDASNLGLILNDFDVRRMLRPEIISRVQKFYELAEDIKLQIFGNTILLYLYEKGFEKPIPATRLSDGTIHFLSLLAILCHPDPPPLVCIEEPEIGLHPDVIPMIAELLIEAAQRTQLIVTTHSADLVSALWEVPESVVVCERDQRGSHLQRLDPDRMKKWLEKYRLGDLWRSGEIGGTRW
jgi:predicted ATPase